MIGATLLSPSRTASEFGTKRSYHKLIYYHKVDKGGHFAAWEQPQLFAQEVRAGWRALRTA